MDHPLRVGTDWLVRQLHDPAIAVLDASMVPAGAGERRSAEADYLAAHIPGAVFLDMEGLFEPNSALPHTFPSSDHLAMHMSRLGVDAREHIVVYDSAGLFSSARAWWTLRQLGAMAVSVLDGGLPRWRREGRALESGRRERPPADFRAKPAHDGLVGIDMVRKAVELGTPQIVDARAAARFRGEQPEPRTGLRSGHIPGSRNVPYTRLVEDGSLVAPARIAQEFTSCGVDLSQPIITMCGSGVTAAVLNLALATIGCPDVKIYDGSWSEWGASEGP